MDTGGRNSFWFSEEPLPGADSSYRVQYKAKEIFRKNSEFTDIRILETSFLGKVLVLDGIISIAEDTEFIYHEMLATAPMLRHPKPKEVLIIGGGDGGACKQVLRFNTVRHVVQVDIDNSVIETCKQYLPKISDGAYSDPRLELIIADGSKFLTKTSNRFDVIIVDITEIVSWGENNILTDSFIKSTSKALKDGGVVSVYGGATLFQADKIGGLIKDFKKHFKNVDIHTAVIPEFEATESCFIIGANSGQPALNEIASRSAGYEGQCRYLSPEIYFRSMELPLYSRSLLGLAN